MNKSNEIDQYALGWAFYKSDGVRGGGFAPLEDDDLEGWMLGFCAALAEYGNDYESVQAALLDQGVDGDVLEACVKAAGRAHDSGEWKRWPSVPVRGLGHSVFVWPGIGYCFPKVANDEMG